MSSFILDDWRLTISVFSLTFSILSLFLVSRWIIFHVFGVQEKNKKGSSEADILAYELVAGLSALYICAAGLLIWFNKLGNIDSLTGDNPMYPYLRDSAVETHILIPMVSYQIVNFFLSFYINDFRSWLGLIHHASAVSIAYYSIISPVWQYYGVYFCGICELSSVPFAIAETFSKFEKYRVKFVLLNQVSRVLFVILFWTLRVAIFLYMSKKFWSDCYTVYYIDQSVQSMPIFVFYLCSNVFMNALQIFWGFQMFGYLEKTISTKDDNKIKNISKELPLYNGNHK